LRHSGRASLPAACTSDAALADWLYVAAARDLTAELNPAVREAGFSGTLTFVYGLLAASRVWARLSDPAMWPAERLFFELYVQALLGRLGDKQFLDSTVEGWLAPVAAAMVEAGDSEATARADARLGMAVVRGLLLDLLATGDRDGVTEAHERFIRHSTRHEEAVEALRTFRGEGPHAHVGRDQAR
jgi:hypothetical protein